MIRIGVAALFVLHGLILLLGFAEGVGFVSLPQLTQPVAGHWSAVACGGPASACRARSSGQLLGGWLVDLIGKHNELG